VTLRRKKMKASQDVSFFPGEKKGWRFSTKRDRGLLVEKGVRFKRRRRLGLSEKGRGIGWNLVLRTGPRTRGRSVLHAAGGAKADYMTSCTPSMSDDE